jgi:hypothetical protein
MAIWQLIGPPPGGIQVAMAFRTRTSASLYCSYRRGSSASLAYLESQERSHLRPGVLFGHPNPKKDASRYGKLELSLHENATTLACLDFVLALSLVNPL